MRLQPIRRQSLLNPCHPTAAVSPRGTTVQHLLRRVGVPRRTPGSLRSLRLQGGSATTVVLILRTLHIYSSLLLLRKLKTLQLFRIHCQSLRRCRYPSRGMAGGNYHHQAILTCFRNPVGQGSRPLHSQRPQQQRCPSMNAAVSTSPVRPAALSRRLVTPQPQSLRDRTSSRRRHQAAATMLLVAWRCPAAPLHLQIPHGLSFVLALVWHHRAHRLAEILQCCRTTSVRLPSAFRRRHLCRGAATARGVHRL